MAQKKTIPNPNTLTNKEKLFIADSLESNDTDLGYENKKDKARYLRRMLSLPKWFDSQLSQYLLDNPHEGTKSSFITRIIAEYIKRQTDKI